MSSLDVTAADPLLTAYLGAYARRLRGPLDVKPFPKPEPNALLAFAHARLARRVSDGRPSDGARTACERLLHALPERRDDPLTAAICNCAAAAAGLADERAETPGGTITPLIAAWRVLDAALATPGGGDPEAIAYLERRRAAGGEIVGPDSHGARISYLLGLAADRLGPAEAGNLMRDLAIEFLNPAAAATVAERAADLATIQLAAVAAAAAVNDLPEVGTAVVEHLAAKRIDPERGLLWAEPGGERYELSPWVVLGLAELHASPPGLDDFYDPPAPAPPSFAIETIVATERGLRLDLRDGGDSATREILAVDLNDMLLATIEEVERDEGRPRPPRQDAHIVVALHSLSEATADDAARDRCAALARTLLDRVVAAQDPNGGWSYSAPDARSVVYTAAGATDTAFPDLQYTIDAAVPGIALSIAHRWLSEPRYLDAALGALRFFEDAIGRLRWEGLRVWRLYPDDDKTERMGTAVNYELWNGTFFAELSRTVGDRRVERRLSGYLDEILRYAERHLGDDGAIGYGDYVREERLPYSAWDAYLLGSIGNAAGRTAATEMGSRILARMDRQLLDSGALPNAWPYAEGGPAGDRWIVHRHGVGPYPVKAYYQLYPVVAAATCGAAEQLALRCFAFAWLDLREEVTGRMSRGYSGAGVLDLNPGPGVAAWKIDAIAALPRLGVPYAPSLGERRDGLARWSELVEVAEAAAREPELEPGEWTPPRWLGELVEDLATAETNPAHTELALAKARRAWLDRFHPRHGDPDAKPGTVASLAYAAALRRAARLSGDEAFDRYARVIVARVLTGSRDALGRWTEGPGGAPLRPAAAGRAAELLRELGAAGVDWLVAR